MQPIDKKFIYSTTCVSSNSFNYFECEKLKCKWGYLIKKLILIILKILVDFSIKSIILMLY